MKKTVAFCLLALGVASLGNAQTQYDLLITGGHVAHSRQLLPMLAS
jgi:hypothetical protein